VESDSSVPPAQLLTDEFAERHHLTLTEIVRREGVAIQALSIANKLVNEAYSQLGDVAFADPAVGLLLNLLNRNFEHAEASIVAFVTGSGSSAEIMARASVESSVNMIYIVAGDRGARLLGYFDDYLEDVDRQTEKWRREVDQLKSDEAKLHLLAIDKRRKANSFVGRVVHSLGISNSEHWPPQIAQRFKAIGESISYRTFFARMSSEVHGDPEETLRYFIGKSVDNGSFFEAMALESVWTSRFYIYYAVSMLLRASQAYSRSYSFPAVEPRLKQELAEVERELIDISAHIGAKL
jgi:Family of unknown function (DUF5677)